MSVRAVRIYGDPVLRDRAREVIDFDDALRSFVGDLFDTMQAYSGVGLAANQVGVLQRVLVVDVPREDGGRDRLALVNPTLDERSGGDSAEEGCLSIPGVWEDVRRATRLRVRAMDPEGRPLEFIAEGYVLVGSPSTVAERIERLRTELGFGAMCILMSIGNISPEQTRRSMELFANEVMPEFRRAGDRTAAATA